MPGLKMSQGEQSGGPVPVSQDATRYDDLVTWKCSVIEILTREKSVHCWMGALLKPSG